MVLMFFVSCGKKGEESEAQQEQISQEETGEQVEESRQDIEENPLAAIKQLTDQVKSQSEKQQGGKIEAAEAGTLKSVMQPIPGWEMEEPEYSKNSFGSVTVATLEGQYTKEGKTVDVDISDAATASAILTPLKMAISLNMSREDSDGFQRIFEYKGHKGIEEYQKSKNNSKVTLIYKDRYVVSLETTSDLTVKELKEMLSILKLSELD